MKKYFFPIVQATRFFLVSFIFTALLLASCSKEEITPNTALTAHSPVLLSQINHQNPSTNGPVVPKPVVPTLANNAIQQKPLPTAVQVSPNVPDVAPLVPANSVIFISHGGCLGTCPTYTVTVMADGTVIFNGIRFVGTQGPVQFNITPELVNRIKEMMINAGFLNFLSNYQMVVDLSQNITAIRFTDGAGNMQLKIVVDWGMNIPEELAMLRNMIEAALGVDKLVVGSSTNAPVNR